METLQFSRFENMQKLEAAGAFDSNILRWEDVRDPAYLRVENQQYAANPLAEFDPRFGYSF